jgi:hypothetical protein
MASVCSAVVIVSRAEKVVMRQIFVKKQGNELVRNQLR